MSTKLPFYYIWTPKYEIFASILKDGIKHYSDYLEDNEIFMTQEEFDNTLLQSSHNGHFMAGCILKPQKIMELLFSLPENSYFIFSDADVVLFPNKKLRVMIDLYIESSVDIVFMRESLSSTISNFGFCLIKVCDANKLLFMNILDMLDKNPTGHDQTLLNEALEKYIGIHAFFPPEFVATTSTILDLDNRIINNNKFLYKNNVMIFQPLTDLRLHGKDVISNKIYQYSEMNVNIEYKK